MTQLYNDYSTYLRKKYGTKVYRIGIDAGFGCPGRCAYCNEDGSRAQYTNPWLNIPGQIRSRMNYLKSRGAEKFIAYFQAFTNTNAAVFELKEAYDKILPFEDIVGLSIGTRPDAVDDKKLKLIASYRDRYEVWIEYGLQSAHDNTLKLINRGHSFADFLSAARKTRELGIMVAAHVMLGLPGETEKEMIETAQRLNEAGIDGIKIHLLHILRGSAMEQLYNEGKIKVLGQDEYVKLVCDFLENLSPDIIIQRLTGEGPRAKHIAPDWALDKTGTINRIKQELEKMGTCQGSKCAHRP